ncbi:MAG: carbohydrate-binding family 9-like protein [Sedimentisphaerales bacterium]
MRKTALIIAGCSVLLAGQILRASPSQYCYRVTTPLTIDGKLDEPAWQSVPAMIYRNLVDGNTPKYATTAKVLWDERYIYIGIAAEEPNVWATLGTKTPQFENYEDETQLPWLIMGHAPFFKFILDPDADGKNYVEIHINALNHTNDAWIGTGSTSKIRQVGISGDNVYFEWHCEDMQSAVWIDGTINCPNDVDKGWSAEVAIPWHALKRFCIGNCPPKPGDVWKAEFGRIFRTKVGGKRTYSLWPVIGIEDCHQTDRFGCLIFSDKAAVISGSPSRQVQKNPLEWKMAWLWTMSDKSDEEIVRLAQSLGFNVIDASRSANMVRECHKVGMKAFGCVSFGCRNEYGQITEPKADELKDWKNPAEHLYQFGGEPIQGGEEWDGHGDNIWCFDRPEAIEYGKKQIDKFIAQEYDGVALDYIGYKNYYACCCPVSQSRQAEYQKQHPEQPMQEVIYKSSEESLVAFCRTLVNYAHDKKDGFKVTCHIYPYFAPNPLYGNKIPFDYCGQTVSWFFQPHWQKDKIMRYVHDLVTYEGDYNPRSIGTPFVGIYALPPYEKHRKSAQEVRDELRIIKKAGAKAIQIAELGNILSAPNISKVISEELGGTWTPSN